MKIRKMSTHDAQAIAIIHTLAWKTAYRGIMDASFLDSLDVKQREVGWKRGIEFNHPAIIRYVAEDDGEVLAFICGMDNRDPGLLPSSDSELWAIYTHPEKTRKGFGRALFNHFKAELKAMGKKRMSVWCLEKNQMGMNFYKALGGKLSPARKTITIAEQALTEVAFEFDLLS